MSKEKIKKRWLFFGRDKYTYDTIEELVKKGVGLKIGEVVTLNGYYTAGDGANHKRVIANEDDGSGVQLINGLWANIVHNGEVNVSWFGAKGDGVTDDSDILIKVLGKKYKKTILDKDKFKVNKAITVQHTLLTSKSRAILDFSDFTGELAVFQTGAGTRIEKLVISTNNKVLNQFGFGCTYSAENTYTNDVIVKGFYNGARFNTLWYYSCSNLRIRDISEQGVGIKIGGNPNTSYQGNEINGIRFENVWIHGGVNNLLIEDCTITATTFSNCTLEGSQETSVISTQRVYGDVKFDNCYWEGNYKSSKRNENSLVLFDTNLDIYICGGLYRDKNKTKSIIGKNINIIGSFTVTDNQHLTSDRAFIGGCYSVNVENLNPFLRYSKNNKIIINEVITEERLTSEFLSQLSREFDWDGETELQVADIYSSRTSGILDLDILFRSLSRTYIVGYCSCKLFFTKITSVDKQTKVILNNYHMCSGDDTFSGDINNWVRLEYIGYDDSKDSLKYRLFLKLKQGDIGKCTVRLSGFTDFNDKISHNIIEFNQN